MTKVIHPTSNLKLVEEQGPFHLSRGKGIYVYDPSGKEYIEGLSGLWCTSLGYGNEELVEAAAQQMRDFSFAHMFGGKTHSPGNELAQTLSDMVPVDDARVFFGNSGSDCNDTHIKLLRYYYKAIGKPEKRKIISRERAYHGITLASACLTGIPGNHANFELPFEALGILRTDCPHYYRNALPGESEAEFVDRLADNLERMIVAEGPETIAAFIAEPINGAGGVVVPPEGYFQRIQAILNRHDILFLDDEVICGFGRTGAAFGADTFDFRPDMMSLAKALSSAYMPISAAVIRGDMYEAMVGPSGKVGVFGHGFTYSGHPVACAVANKTLEIYKRDRLFEKAAETGAYMHQQLARFKDHPLVGEVRGLGLIAGLELVANKATKRAFDGGKVSLYCQDRCEEHGLITRAIFGNTVALCPPLIISTAEVDEMLARLERGLNDTLEYAHKEGLLG